MSWKRHTQSVGLPLFNIPCNTFGIVLLASLGSSDLWYIGFLPPKLFRVSCRSNFSNSLMTLRRWRAEAVLDLFCLIWSVNHFQLLASGLHDCFYLASMQHFIHSIRSMLPLWVKGLTEFLYAFDKKWKTCKSRCDWHVFECLELFLRIQQCRAKATPWNLRSQRLLVTPMQALPGTYNLLRAGHSHRFHSVVWLAGEPLAWKVFSGLLACSLTIE